MTAATRATIFDLLVDALARHTGCPVEEIRADQAIADIPGMESVRLLRLLTEFEDTHKASVPDTFPFDVATVRDLAEALAAGTRDADAG